METKNIFVDTQVFVQQGLKFENQQLRRLYELGKDERIRIFISEVVKQEVAGKFANKVHKALQSKKSMMKELEVLEELLPPELTSALEKCDESSLIEVSLSKWNAFIEGANVQVISPDNICNSELLSLYFSGSFPFSDGKKKSEFPDAISLLSLKSQVEDIGEKIYVISGDKDLKGFCDKQDEFIYINHLAEFFDIYNRSEERLSEVVHRLLERNEAWLLEALGDAFINCDFIYENDYEADVENPVLKYIDIVETNIITVDSRRAEISILAEVGMQADICGPDYDNAMWDSEEKEYIVFDSYKVTREFDSVYSMSIVILLGEKQEYITKLGDFSVDEGTTVSLHYDDYSWHK
ncbi:PIN domain-containing protein [Pseudoalteromonas peptidolytica]|uniref:PIN domain-containing protein n=1 Tax=Pseudoalteromonas peptidolytica TaxID=61150 RepID=UPI00298D98B7|nr:PIN domain-containing protein [Pseudoalteromonas peptidolytica]MDW7547483.1 PIN domain-containing protein [Pseudoalteromonas peptidolytica]